MKRNIAIVVVALLVIGAGVYFWMKMGNKTDTSTSSTSSSSTASTQPAAATITYSDSGFSPAKTTVKAGDTVAIKNDSSSDVQMDSDPHPIHTDDEDLNVGAVSPGQTKTFTVTKTGTFGFHNHLNPGQKGTIVIE